MPGLSPKVGIGVNRKSTPYWTPLIPLGGETVNFWAKGRSGLTIPDSVGSNDVSILTPTFVNAGSPYGLVLGANGVLERIMDGNTYTIYFKFKLLSNSIDATLLSLGNYTSNGETGISFYGIGSTLYIKQSDGTQTIRTDKVNVSNDLIAAGWIEVIICIDSVGKTISYKFINISTGLVVNATLDFSVDISTFSLTQGNNAYGLNFGASTTIRVAYCDFKKFTGLKTLAQCQNNSYITDLQFYYPTIYDGTDVSSNAYHCTVRVKSIENQYYSNVSTYLLDKGYSYYSEDAFQTTPVLDRVFYIPFNLQGNPIVRGNNTIRFGANDTFIDRYDVLGDLVNHNLCDSKLRFPLGSKWDRSDVTIYSDKARATNTYYDSSNPTDWHISELSKFVIEGFCNVNYRGLLFQLISVNSFDDRHLLKELFSFANNKTGSNLKKVQVYNNDYQIPKVYNKGQLVITWDDGTWSQFFKLFPIIKAKGIKTTHYLPTDLMGTANNNYLNWKEVQEMYAYGLDMQCHSQTHTDLTSLTQAQVLAEYAAVNAIYETYGIPAPKFTAYPFGTVNANVKTWTATMRLTARVTSGTQPFIKTTDKMQIPSYAIDGLGDAGVITLKGYMDIARANNSIICLYGHNVDGTGITTVRLGTLIDYALLIGVEIVTMSELYDNVLSV
jgi:peptidoglycan/xylan/chitin deacetylase (PgdA/CDA1 family)